MYQPKPALERFAGLCDLGEGQLQLYPLYDKLFTTSLSLGSAALPHSVALFAPHNNQVAESPFTSLRLNGELYRGPTDFRSITMSLDNQSESFFAPGSVTLKGGDLRTMSSLPIDVAQPVWQRIAINAIPGAGVMSNMQTEYEAAYNLQAQSLIRQGRLTYTAQPLEVRTITAVPIADNGLVPAKDYLNSVDYSFINGFGNREKSEYLKMPLHKVALLGDLLIDARGLVPAHYLYAVPHHNIRTNQLVDALRFTRPDTSAGSLHFRADEIPTYSDEIPAFKGRKQQVLHSVYRLLSQAYGFEAEQVLPRQKIQDKNYHGVRKDILTGCDRQNIGRIVLHKYMKRLAEVAALGHSQEMTFSMDYLIGGSFNKRNTTYAGIVLDLDTYGPLADHWKWSLRQDFYEIAESTYLLQSAVASTNNRQPEKQLLQIFREYYQENLEKFHTASTLRDRLLRELTVSENFIFKR